MTTSMKSKQISLRIVFLQSLHYSTFWCFWHFLKSKCGCCVCSCRAAFSSSLHLRVFPPERDVRAAMLHLRLKLLPADLQAWRRHYCQTQNHHSGPAEMLCSLQQLHHELLIVFSDFMCLERQEISLNRITLMNKHRGKPSTPHREESHLKKHLKGSPWTKAGEHLHFQNNPEMFVFLQSSSDASPCFYEETNKKEQMKSVASTNDSWTHKKTNNTVEEEKKNSSPESGKVQFYLTDKSEHR